MAKIRYFVALMALMAISFCSSTTTASARNSGRSVGAAGGPGTLFEVYNPSHPDVEVWVVVPTSSNLGCGPTSLSQVQVLDVNNKNPLPITPFGDSQHKGFFMLKRGRSAYINPTGSASCLDGLNVTFLNHPQCPCTNTCAGDKPFIPGPNLPNGTNFVEATLNSPGTFNETVDISCVNGANTTVSVDFQGGPNWNDGGSNRNVTHIQNSWVNVNCNQGAACDNNCSLTGVFPYNATLCEKAGAGACPNASSPPFCLATGAHCNIQRDRQGGEFGGLVKATYLGPLAPPN